MSPLVLLLVFAGAGVLVPIALRRAGRAPGQLIERIWLVVFEPVRAIVDLLGALRRRVDQWWETARDTAMPHGWSFGRLIVALVGSVVWVVIFVADLGLFANIVQSGDFHGGVSKFMTVAVILGTSVAGLCLADALGIGRVFPRRSQGRRHMVGAVGAGAVLVSLLGFQAYLGGIRAVSIYDQNVVQVHQLEQKAAGLQADGFPIEAAQAEAKSKDLAAANNHAEPGRMALSRGGPVVLGGLEALTSGALFALLALAGAAAVGAMRFSLALAQRAAALVAAVTNHFYVIHRQAFEPDWSPPTSNARRVVDATPHQVLASPVPGPGAVPGQPATGSDAERPASPPPTSTPHDPEPNLVGSGSRPAGQDGDPRWRGFGL